MKYAAINYYTHGLGFQKCIPADQLAETIETLFQTFPDMFITKVSFFIL